MTAGTPPDGDASARRRLDNGLAATRYVPLTDVDAELAPHLLTALARARIAAYLGDVPAGAAPGGGPAVAASARRLYVAAEERADARTIVAAVLRTVSGAPGDTLPALDPLLAEGRKGGDRDEIDFDAAFAELIADWPVDTIAAIREAERALSREDADWRARLEQGAADPVWLDEHHYVPPPPPPLPRLAGPTLLAVVLIVASVLLFVFGAELGLDYRFTLLLGVGGVLVAAGLLIMRLRDRDEDDGDDGAVV